jgi:hypothetical protein
VCVQQKASSLAEYDLMMVPYLMTMRMRSRTLKESSVQNLRRKEVGACAWYVQGCGYRRKIVLGPHGKPECGT